jgi:hypothetical protein
VAGSQGDGTLRVRGIAGSGGNLKRKAGTKDAEFQ